MRAALKLRDAHVKKKIKENVVKIFFCRMPRPRVQALSKLGKARLEQVAGKGSGSHQAKFWFLLQHVLAVVQGALFVALCDVMWGVAVHDGAELLEVCRRL